MKLPFYAWPSSPDLPFSVSSDWSIQDREYVEMEREGSITIPLSNRVDFPFYVKNFSYEFETPCFNKFGERVSTPSMSLKDGWIVELSEEVFAVVRFRFVAVGYKYNVVMTFDKGSDELDNLETTKGEDGNSTKEWVNVMVGSGYDHSSLPPPQESENDTTTPSPSTGQGPQKITNVQSHVTAIYSDEDGKPQKEELEIKIPQCVKDYLEKCPDGDLPWDVYGNAVYNDEDKVPVIYYSTCTGNVLEVRYEE